MYNELLQSCVSTKCTSANGPVQSEYQQPFLFNSKMHFLTLLSSTIFFHKSVVLETKCKIGLHYSSL